MINTAPLPFADGGSGLFASLSGPLFFDLFVCGSGLRGVSPDMGMLP